jgi:hypothetical protein
MHYTFALLALFVAAHLLPQTISAQSELKRTNRSLPTKSSNAKSLRAFEKQRVNAELERQQRFLRDVTSRFEAVALNDITPLLEYSYIWMALRDNRERMGRSGRSLTATQSKLVADGYDKLEKEVVATFGDHQLSILNEVLELNDQQLQDIQMIVEDDLNSRRDLLKTKGLSPRDFANRVSAISKGTETRILGALSPAQRKVFDRQLNFNRDRLVG